MSEKINIVTSGCSFTETAHSSIIDYKNIKEITTAINENFQLLNYVYFLAEEMYRYHKNDFTIYNLAKGSAGNHVIFSSLKMFMENNNLDNVYSTIQLSGVLRGHSNSNRFIEINHLIDEWMYDYDVNKFSSYQEIIDKQVQVYKKIQTLLDGKNAKNKLFFGWGVLSVNDINSIKDIQDVKIDTYITKTTSMKCTDLPSQSQEKFYAGMSEFLEEQNLPISIYKSSTDFHLTYGDI